MEPMRSPPAYKPLAASYILLHVLGSHIPTKVSQKDEHITPTLLNARSEAIRPSASYETHQILMRPDYDNMMPTATV